MKKIIAALTMALLIVLVLTATASAEEASSCISVTFTMTPESGSPGTSVAVSATGSMPSNPYSIHWETAAGTTLASGNADGSGNVATTITIPADATVGAHSVYFNGATPQEATFECPFPFTVVAATADTGAGPDAYATVSALPSTGLMAVLLVTGLASAGAGVLLVRKRS